MLIWFIALVIFSFIRGYGHEVRGNIEEIQSFSIWDRLLFQVVIGIIAGILFGSYSYLFSRLTARKYSFTKTLVAASTGYALIILTFILFVFRALERLFSIDLDAASFRSLFSSGQGIVIVFYCYLVGFIIEFISQVNRNFGPGNLSKMIRGKFYTPKQEDRIFMFLDMRSSTTIAEKLGHLQYSRLLQDCFRDIDAVAPFLRRSIPVCRRRSSAHMEEKPGIAGQ